MTGGAIRLDVRDIAAMLNQRIERLCHELLPAGQKNGGEWRIGSIAGEPGDSIQAGRDPSDASAAPNSARPVRRWCSFSAKRSPGPPGA